MVIRATRSSSPVSLSRSVASATSSKNSPISPLASANSFCPSTKSLIPFNNSSIFSILPIPSGVPSFLNSNKTPDFLATCSARVKASALSFMIWKLLIMATKSPNFLFVPELIFKSILSRLSITSKIERL